MSRELVFGRKAVGKPRRMVIFVHGYGANGEDLLSFAEVLAPYLPDTVFIAPDAPEALARAAFGRQWFPIPWIDGSSEAQSQAGVALAREDLNDFVTARLAEEGIAAENTVVLGFSQGAMLALDALPGRTEPLAGIIAVSGLLMDAARLDAARSKPPVLILHGDGDEVVPFAAMDHAAKALQARGFAVETHVMRGMGHGISQDGLVAILDNLRARLD
jgi:phospholipase/carboxylesterase